MKRFLSLVLAITAVLSVFTITAPTEVSAASTSASIREVKNITIFNKATNQAFCHEYQKVGDGVRVWSWQYDGEGNNFNIEKVKDGVYRLVTTVNPSYAIDVNCPGKIRNKNLLKKNLQVDLWKKGGSEGFAQNLIIEACGEGYYYLRMAENQNLCLASSGKNKRIVLATFTGSNSQKWTFKDAQGKNVVDITTTSTTTSNATTGIPTSAYKKTGVVFTISGSKYYEAVTTRAYNGLASGSDFFVDAQSRVVTDTNTLQKLYSLVVFNGTRANQKSAAELWVSAAQDYYAIYTNIAATEKMGEIIGKGSGALLSLGAGNSLTLKESLIELGDSVVSLDTLKAASLLGMVRYYTNNVVANGNKAAAAMKSTITDYDTMVSAVSYYAECAASFKAVDFLVGDQIKELSQSSTLKELGKYFDNVVVSFADAILPDLKAVEVTKAITDGVVSLSEIAVNSGAASVHDKELTKQKAFLSESYAGAKSVADKLAKTETAKFVMPLTSKYSTNIVTQEFGNYYSVMGGRHLGTDIGTSGNRATNVNAIADGIVYRVLKTAKSGGYGNLVVLQHQLPTGQVFFSAYGHLQNYSVREGQKVVAGENIGVMGSTGNSSGPHVHLAVYSGSVSKATIPTGYTSEKVTGDSFKVGKLTYYDPIRVIETNGTIIK